MPIKKRLASGLSDMSDSGVVQNGYQIKRVASTVYKIIKSTRHEEDFPK